MEKQMHMECIGCWKLVTIPHLCRSYISKFTSQDIKDFMEEFHKSWSYEWHTDNREVAVKAIKDFLLSKNLYDGEKR